MIKKIKSSLWLKVFLVLTILLLSVSFLLYGIIMTFMPASYKSLVASDYTRQISELVTELEGCSLDEATDALYEFGLNHSAAIQITGKDNSISLGGEGEQKNNTTETISVHLNLKDGAYMLTISIASGSINQITHTFLQLLPTVGIIVLAISLIASYTVSRFLTKPIIEISNISKRLTELDMTWRCNTTRTDEIGVLACNLNTMATKLDAAMNDLTNANEKLQADIERERLQEKMRVDFFRAVSHELKTPITVLKGEVEGMIYQVGEYKDRDTHLRHSMRTIKELETLVQEILSVSRMTGNDFSLTLSKIHLSELVRECCRKWQGIAEDKEQPLITDIDTSCVCMGDTALLQKAISNIIGNAVIHSPKQAAISISLHDRTLQVRNDGISISSDELTHIFEPFYRVENSHNRQTGGSGLGLYIVKTILERHHLQYNIESTSTGVCFTIFF